MSRRPRRNQSAAFKAKALGISRSSINYRTRPVSEADLGLMRRIDPPRRTPGAPVRGQQRDAGACFGERALETDAGT